MYITLNQETLSLNFNPHPQLKITGPDPLYYVELREYKKGEDQSVSIESYKVTNGGDIDWKDRFKCGIEFYCDFEISVDKYIPDYGMKRIFTHRYNDYGKMVLFNLVTNNINEAKLWSQRVDEYQRIHGCKVVLHSQFDKINKKYLTYYETGGIDYYKTYNIGRFPKQSTDWRTIDPRKEGVIWYGYWKTFWSYQHPRPWNTLSSQEIVDDILGL